MTGRLISDGENLYFSTAGSGFPRPDLDRPFGNQIRNTTKNDRDTMSHEKQFTIKEIDK